uniref:Ig-like domain-containing protein n=1 Tax=Cynoglossus semilaevis TaxID=244447 RepID=A0A3P8VVY3_CYNSE
TFGAGGTRNVCMFYWWTLGFCKCWNCSSTSSPHTVDKNAVVPFHLSAAPVIFTKKLENLDANEGDSVTLSCELSKPASVVWRHGDTVLESSSKYQLKQEGTSVQLIIYKLQGADSGEYSCDTGSQRTSAVLSVQDAQCEVTLTVKSKE